MRISDVLRVKGAHVVTVPPDTTVRRLLAVLAEHRIGAVVISADGASVDGIASERDIVWALPSWTTFARMMTARPIRGMPARPGRRRSRIRQGDPARVGEPSRKPMPAGRAWVSVERLVRAGAGLEIQVRIRPGTRC